MAAPTNTLASSTRVGLREDLSDKIYDVSKADTPFISSIGKDSASAVYHEWQTDALEAAEPTNAQVQGNDAPITAPAATVRRGNYSQIMTEAISVSGTLEAVSKAGRKSEMVREMAKKVKKQKRSMEARATGNYAAVPPVGSSTAGEAAGALAWMTTNVDRGATGANATFTGGYPSAAATNGTLRDFTEALVKSAMLKAFNSGGEPSIAIMPPALKQTASTFAGIAQQRKTQTGKSPATIIGAADVYVSDFGEIQFVADRHCSTRDVLIVDPEYWSLSFLRKMAQEDLAKTGDSSKKQLLAEWTLCAKNEASSTVIADVQAP